MPVLGGEFDLLYRAPSKVDIYSKKVRTLLQKAHDIEMISDLKSDCRGESLTDDHMPAAPHHDIHLHLQVMTNNPYG